MEVYHSWFGHGSQLYDGASSTYGPIPGYLVGGPNQFFSVASINPPAGQPPMKAFRDWNTGWPENSWEITEPAIYYQAAYSLLLSPFATDATPPRVTDVFVSGGAWTQAYRNTLQASGQRDAPYGYRIKPNEQTRTMAWSNLNRVSVRFSEHVNVAADDLGLTGRKGSVYELLPGAAGFTYDPASFTATWTLARTVPNDKVVLNLDGDHGPDGIGVTDPAGNLLDGEWLNPLQVTPAFDSFPSGNGSPGGDFVFSFRVLPGDIDRDGAVNVFDYNVLRLNFNQTGKGVAGGDINGDNLVSVGDYNEWRAYLNRTAPL